MAAVHLRAHVRVLGRRAVHRAQHAFRHLLAGRAQLRLEGGGAAGTQSSVPPDAALPLPHRLLPPEGTLRHGTDRYGRGRLRRLGAPALPRAAPAEHCRTQLPDSPLGLRVWALHDPLAAARLPRPPSCPCSHHQPLRLQRDIPMISVDLKQRFLTLPKPDNNILNGI